MRAHVQGCAPCQQRLTSGSSLDATLDSQKTLQREGLPNEVLGEGVLVGPYRVARRLGAGAMGAVFAAWDARLEREVALKVLHLDGDLQAEARLLAKLSHPNVVGVYEVLSWQGRAVLVMELGRGASLREWLAQAPRSTGQVLELFVQCARGLSAAHAAGIVHRDFKPDNVLIDETGRARLLDFGLAMPTLGATGGLAGSPAYLGLHQLQGAPADAGSDQFAWWVSLYEALTAQRPADASTLAGLLEARRAGTFSLAGVPRWLRPAMVRGLSNEPSARFASMEDAARALTRRRPAPLVMAAALVLAGVAAAALLARAPSPCEGLSVSADALLARATEPALRSAVTDYSVGQERCRALPQVEQAARAACLEQTGLELDVALEALEGEPVEPSLLPRVLKRVRPASRCERSPAPVNAGVDADRRALVESLRAQLRVDALRASGQPARALEVAQAHVAAMAGAGPSARAWAGITAAAALSGQGRPHDALLLFRELEALAGAGPRERTWIAVGRWLFECYGSAQDHCAVSRQQAQRLSAELDEPWARAFEQEVLSNLEDVEPRAVVEAWKRLPGAGPETRRAVATALRRGIAEDSLVHRREALALAAAVEQPDAQLTELRLRLEVAQAAQQGDLAAARKLFAELEALPETPTLARARFDTKLSLLTSAGRHQDVLELLSRNPGSGRTRGQALLMKLRALRGLASPLLDETLAQLELLEETFSMDEAGFLDSERVCLALAAGDVAQLAELPVTLGDELSREWQLAVLRGDAGAEREVLDRAGARSDAQSKGLQLEALVRAGEYEQVARLAPALRAECPSLELELQLRLLEAWAAWKLDRHEHACRLMSQSVLQAPLVARQRARAEALLRGCPRVGLSGWDD